MSVALVTGATGFLGRHLVQHLASEGFEVHVLHRVGSDAEVLSRLAGFGAELHAFDAVTTVPDAVVGLVPDVVFHLATLYLKDHSAADVAPLIEANVTFGSQLFESLVGSDAVVISTMSYLQFSGGSAVPVSLYSATKQAFLEIGRYYRECRGLDVRQVILYDTYGPADSRDKLVPRLVEALETGESVSFGRADQPLNMLFASDVSRGLVSSAGVGAPSTMTIRAREMSTVGAIVSAFESAAGRILAKSFNSTGSVNDLVHRAGDWPTPPGWQPRVSLDEGARLTLATTNTHA